MPKPASHSCFLALIPFRISTIMRSALSPLAPGQWIAFMSQLASIRLVLEVPLLPARIVLGVLLTPTYRNFTMRLRQALPLRESEPVLNRVLAIVAAWAVGNAAAALPAALMVLLGSQLIGVPIFV